MLRAGILFHARGLINTKAIQHNMDWVWPYWVQRQFNPNDSSFIPRAFSFSHVNLTHRNWTAVGLPELPLYPIVDPRGLVTPLFDGWSIDFWIVPDEGDPLIPSRLDTVEQKLHKDGNLTVETVAERKGLKLKTAVEMVMADDGPELEIRAAGLADRPAGMVFSIRPYNPEGIQFVETLAFDRTSKTWSVNASASIKSDKAPDRVVLSAYDEGDVFLKLDRETDDNSVECDIGLANGAGVYKLRTGIEREVRFRMALGDELKREFPGHAPKSRPWDFFLEKTAKFAAPDKQYLDLYETGKRTLIMLSAKEPYPGPYTYRRFWFRDACLMVNALLALNLTEKCRAIIDDFDKRQTIGGYFKSQKGEWDSNGQVLWIMHRYLELTGEKVPRKWFNMAMDAANWIRRKRRENAGGSPHPGLLPPGFSAEHLGPNDYYYWDDFWSLSGLKCAASMAESYGRKAEAAKWKAEAALFELDIWKSIGNIPEKRSGGAIPASPNRRMDAGAVGSLAADYPLRLVKEGDPGILGTVEFLIENCFHSGGFFQDMIHSGINAYLTLDIAQTLLRAGDPKFSFLVRAAADLASPTGQWPEAIHPITKGGCMGDGQHGWAAAEWIMIIRNMFVREEDDRLILGSGIDPMWLESDGEVAFGPTPTPYGEASLKLAIEKGRVLLSVSADWRRKPGGIVAAVPGFRRLQLDSVPEQYELERMAR